MSAVRLLPIILLIGCTAAPDAERAAQAEVRDSAGIELVHNLDAGVDTLAVQLVPGLRIGTVDGAETTQFHRISGVELDAAGRFFVIDQGTQAVRVFGADGAFVRQFGGPGSGPGEFQRISSLFRWRDTLHVADGNRFLSTLFDTAGHHLATLSHLLPNRSVVRPVAGGAEGWYFSDDSLFSRRQREQLGVGVQYSWPVRRGDPARYAEIAQSRAAADTLLSDVATVRSQRIFGMLGSEGGSERFVLGNPPFFEPRGASTVDGRGYVYVTAGWPYVIDVYGPDGALIRRISRAHDSIAVTDALVGSVLSRARSHYDTVSRVEGASYHTYAERAKMPRVGFLPVTGALRASDDGWLWVRRLDIVADPVVLEWSMGTPPRPSYWDVFDPDGRFLAMVRLPAGFTLHRVTADAVIGVARDELDVEYVVLYQLQRNS